MAQAFYIETPHPSRHDTSADSEPHPEQSARLAWIRQALGDAGLLDTPALTELEDAAPADSAGAQHNWALDELSTVHDNRYLRKLARACLHAAKYHEQYVDVDTYITRDTIGVITDSVAAVRQGARQAVSATAAAFCAIRPPGHHAGSTFWGGFCLANFSAYAARQLQAAGAEQVAIIDWDAHHGNGTQSIFYADPSVYYLSLHANNGFPQSGFARERGTGAGKGFTHNIGLPPGTADAEYLEHFVNGIGRAHAVCKPDAVVISAGFDAHARDPLGSLSLSSELYGTLTDTVRRTWQDIPIVSVLEGGYDHRALGESVVSHVRSLTI